MRNNRWHKCNAKKKFTSKNSTVTTNLAPFISSPSEEAPVNFLINFIMVITSQIQKITSQKIATKGGKKCNAITTGYKKTIEIASMP